MSELCISSTTPHDTKFHSLLLHYIFFILSSILSHPLYFSYFIFFSPYLLKLLSFLSPLFLTTTLLLLTLSFHFHHHHLTLNSPRNTPPGFLLSTFLKIAEKLRFKNNQENHEDMYNFEEFQVYKIVFDHTPTFDHHELTEIPIQVTDSDADCVTKFCTHEVSSVTVEERKFGNFLELLDKFENMDKKKKVVVVADEPLCSKSNKVVVGGLQKEKEDLITGSKATPPIKILRTNDDCATFSVGTTANAGDKVKSNANLEKNGGNVNHADASGDSSRSFGSYGSMRKEKEWKRTLACKLFEERHNAGGEDGMDSLWETYETKLSKKDSKKVNVVKSKISDTNVNAKKKNRKVSGISEHYYDFDNEKEEDDYEEDDDLRNGQICCLQALKMSSGKMNFGMGKPNIAKISKVLKGFGWLQHVSKHGKRRA